MAGGVEFDWCAGNLGHLRTHGISPREFEEVILNEPLDLEYQAESGEERYKSLGATNSGRILIVVWTVRAGRIRAVTAYPAGPPYRRLWTKRSI